LKKIIITFLTLIFVSNVQATIITTTGEGTAVTDIDRIATFDNISGSLLGYTEDNILVSVDDTQCCLESMYYGSGGNDSFVTISTTDGIDFFGLELQIGSGYSSAMHNVVWEIKRDGITTGTGVLYDIYTSSLVNERVTLGWSDVGLFDTLLIGASLSSNNYNAFGQSQAIALDNVKIDFGDIKQVPEPISILLFFLGFVGIIFTKNKTA